VGAGERLAAALLLLIAAPLLAAIYVIHRLVDRDGGPFLYSGERMGAGGRTFRILKVRTLARDSEARLRGRLHRDGSGMELKTGRFLRSTRLDELPQLVNIVRGEMRFIGPRPERPCVYDRLCRDIPGYAARFAVPPGLTGLAQFLTPHSTDKRIRARIDSLMLRNRRGALWGAAFLAWTVYAVARNTARELQRALQAGCRMRLAGWAGTDRRQLGRKDGAAFSAHLADDRFGIVEPLSIVDINEDHLLVRGGWPLALDRTFLFTIAPARGRRRRRIRCRGEVVQEVRRGCGSAPCYLVRFEPASIFQRYLMESHILGRTIAAGRGGRPASATGRRAAGPVWGVVRAFGAARA
jgi:lipopolysaccharide/colanic/teichoic acid biosynthesis glycosyltransferase